ncbi:MAG: hypothetical protein K0S47_1888 [Herbinix sp.]|jgi:putative protease|nr:hypothetical protein [Herbinix sp.]
MKQKIEILAPAGSYEGMKAAINAGCDAVYIGGSSFGARAYANNLDEEILLRAIDETHIRGKNLYLTVNTLVKEQEMIDQLHQFLDKFYLQGLDAVIVQDVGVMHFIHRHFPLLPIHASTQTTITMAQGANLLTELGVTRLVTARELSLTEIKLISEQTDLEIETFVHGALCYCYSGQCLMSSLIGGRSGNRGRCAQPCRMAYEFYSGDKKISAPEQKYLLSPKDICTVEMIPEMVEAGINSFKIEGRMKRPEYAAAVSSVYRKYLDLYTEVGKEGFKKFIKDEKNEYIQDITMLQDIYNRGGFSGGYLKTHNSKNMMSLYRPNHSGVYIGDVSEVKGSQVVITLREGINAQDILEIRNSEESGYEFTVKDAIKAGNKLRTNVGHAKITVGLKVYRTKNNLLLDHLEEQYGKTDKKLPVEAVLIAKVDAPLTLTLRYQGCEVTATHEIVQMAMKQPMTEEKLSSQISKTGDTMYYMKNLTIEADQNIFVPVAWLNEVRREALLQLSDAVAGKYHRSVENPVKSMNEKDTFTNTLQDNRTISDKDSLMDMDKKTHRVYQDMKPRELPGICVCVQTQEQFQVALKFPEVTAIYADEFIPAPEVLLTMAKQAKQADKGFYVVLPHILRETGTNLLQKHKLPLLDDNINGYVIKNFEEISFLTSLLEEKGIQKEIILNHNLYLFNREAKDFYRGLGINHFTAPVELNYKELKRLQITDCDMIVYGYLPVMVSAQCLFESTGGCNRCEGRDNRNSYLTDRFRKKFLIKTNCTSCYNTIYNSDRLSLLKQADEILSMHPYQIRLDFTVEQQEEMHGVLEAYIERFLYGRTTKFEMEEYTTGHFKRGVE